MKRVIVISGSPGTGKTTLAKLISNELGFEYVDVNKIIDKYNLGETFDKKRECKIIDVQKLNKELVKLITRSKQSLVVDSHLAHHISKEFVDLVIITKCCLKILKKRLEERKYSKLKVRENLDSEIFDVCLTEAKELEHLVLEVDVSKEKNKKKLVKKITQAFLEKE